MAGTNTRGLVLGTIAAGLRINVVESVMDIFVLAGLMERLVAARNLPVVMSLGAGRRRAHASPRERP